MSKIFKFNEKNLRYEPIKFFGKVRLTLFTLSLMLVSFSIGYLSSIFAYKHYDYHNTSIVPTDISQLPIGSQQWRDSVFADYERRAEIYLKLKYPKSPIKAGMLALAAHNAYDSTGILVPVEFALTQAQIESSMGTKGRSPVNNPFNIGEYDSGTVMWFDSTFDGIQAYYYFITKNYLRCKSLDMLFKNFTNCSGKRYASKPTYEGEVSNQYNYIRRFIDREVVKLKTSKVPSKVKPN